MPFGGGSCTGLDTRIELTPDVVYIKEFQLRDENGAPLTVSGQLAVHERKVGAVDVNLTSNNFEVIDNQLGDVGLGSKLKITGELRRPRVVGELGSRAVGSSWTRSWRSSTTPTKSSPRRMWCPRNESSRARGALGKQHRLRW